MALNIKNAEVERLAAEVLQCDILPCLSDPQLDGLRVFSVTLAGGLSCLNVLLSPEPETDLKSPDEVNAALSRIEGRVRSELASAMRIKRMPAVRLRYVPVSSRSSDRDASEEGGVA